MKIWDKAKEFCRDHKTGIKCTLLGIGGFAGGAWLMRKWDLTCFQAGLEKIASEQENQAMIPKTKDTAWYMTPSKFDEELPAYEEQQKEWREKYTSDFDILDSAAKQLENQDFLWMISEGEVALVDDESFTEES